MLRALYSGISGMKVNQTKMDVIGNNIANVGTTAFKNARVRFQDMLSQNVTEALGPGLNQGGINPRQVGLGVQVGGIDTIVSQGMMQPTSRNLDAAIDGEGYFMVAKGPAAYTSGTGITLTDAKEIDTTATTSLSPMYTRDGAFTLDNDGNLLTSDGYRVMGYSLSDGNAESLGDDGATPPKAVMNFVNADSASLVNTGDLRTLVIPDTVTSGDKQLRIRSFSIEKDGVIKAVLEDGSVSALGQISMASFKNPAGLTKMGRNLYQNSANSGSAVVRAGIDVAGGTSSGSSGYGDMLQGMLEMSNVDLAEQFTDMIVTSRAFQANSKVITTGDEILQDILNIKR